MKKIALFVCFLLISSAYADALVSAGKKDSPFILYNKLFQYQEVNGSRELVELINNCPSNDVGEMVKFHKTKQLLCTETIIHAQPGSGIETFIGYFLVGNQVVKKHYTLDEHGNPKLQSVNPTWIPVRPTTFGWIVLVASILALLLVLFFKNKTSILLFFFKMKKPKKSFASRFLK